MAKIKKPILYLVDCSNRAMGNWRYFIDNFKKLESEEDLIQTLEETGKSGLVNNSEIGLYAAYFGAEKRDVEIRHLYLLDYCKKDGTYGNLGELSREIKQATGFVFATPVYFGDISSTLEEFTFWCEQNGISFHKKVVGMISVGAKRQGGQETAIVSGLHRFMQLGAIVCNDGAPISQFGGTLVMGSLGAPLDTSHNFFGIRTCIGVGRRVAELSLILANGKTNCPIKVMAVVLADKGGKALETAQKFGNWLDVTKLHFNRELGHNAGNPFITKRTLEQDYKTSDCTDDMHTVQKHILDADLIIPIAYYPKDKHGWDNVFSRFMERTRHWRRDGFRLTYHVIAPMCLADKGVYEIFNQRIIPMFIKENAILYKPFMDGDNTKKLYELVSIIKTGKQFIKLDTQHYVPIGHKDEK